MKKTLLTGILTILFVSANYAQVKVGVTAGLNASSFVQSGADNKHKAGFQAGLVADFGITENFSIVPELLFSQRGGKHKALNAMDEQGMPAIASESLRINYLQLPVNLAYKFDVGDGSKLFVFAGPYFGYGLSGRGKIETKTADAKVNVSGKVEFGSKEDELKRFDLGINAGIGYQFDNVYFKLQYNPGLTNLSNEKKISMKNTNISLSAGYYFI